MKIISYLKLKIQFCPLVVLFSFVFVLSYSPIFSQNKQGASSIIQADSSALENIIVEPYYISNELDWSDTLKSPLPKGSVTYRIFVDMKPGYKLQLVYGNQKHELFIETSTRFYNDNDADALTGYNINVKHLNWGNVALDSWITLNAACRGFAGILRSEDTTGFSLISNRPSLKLADGFIKGVLPDFKVFNLDLNFFNNDTNAVRFSTNNGGWAAPGGVKGPTSENRVLIAQLTTNGKLSFQLNVQIGTPSGDFIKFVADNPEEGEIKFDGLKYSQNNSKTK